MPRLVIGSTQLGDAPTTPLRIMLGIAEAAAFVIVHLVLIIINADIPIEISGMVGAFILVQEGIDVRQWKWKRDTDIDYQLAKNGTPRTVVTADHATVTAERAEVRPATAVAAATTGTTGASATIPAAVPAELPARDEAGE